MLLHSVNKVVQVLVIQQPHKRAKCLPTAYEVLPLGAQRGEDRCQLLLGPSLQSLVATKHVSKSMSPPVSQIRKYDHEVIVNGVFEMVNLASIMIRRESNFGA